MKYQYVIKQYKSLIFNMLESGNYEISSRNKLAITLSTMVIVITHNFLCDEIDLVCPNAPDVTIKIFRFSKIGRRSRKIIRKFIKTVLSKAWQMLNDNSQNIDYFAKKNLIDANVSPYHLIEIPLDCYTPTIYVKVYKNGGQVCIYPSIFTRVNYRLRKIKKIFTMERKARKKREIQKRTEDLYTKLFEEI